MSVLFAWLSVVLIWSTTPLAIKVSATGAGFSYALVLRMAVGLTVLLPLLWLLRVRVPTHGRALRSYLAGGLGLFGTMICVYWSARFVPSGLISVLFGLSPLVTGLFALVWLRHEADFPWYRIAGMLLGVAGLAVIFLDRSVVTRSDVLGVFGVLLAVAIQALSLVWVKRVNDDSPPLATTLGILLVSLPFFLLVWWLGGAPVPQHMTAQAQGAIVYLAIAGSIVGFALYYYVIKHLDTGRVSLITLVTPVLALLLGRWLNSEAVGLHVWLGTALIGCALIVYQGREFLALGRLRSGVRT